LNETGLSYIMRAHEAHANGVSISKSARVFTIFSTSKDHHQGRTAVAGCILVDNDAIQVITRSPKYRNRVVHRRGSVSVQGLSWPELAERQLLGLVVADEPEDVDHNVYDNDSSSSSSADDNEERLLDDGMAFDLPAAPGGAMGMGMSNTMGMAMTDDANAVMPPVPPLG